MFDIFKKVVKKEKKQESFNFDKSIKLIKKLIAKSNFDLAFSALRELYEKEKKSISLFIDKKEYDDLLKIFQKREKEINKLFYDISFKKAKNECIILLKSLDYKYKNKDFSNIENDLKELKTNYIDKFKEFDYLKSFYNKFEKKYLKIKEIAYTKNVSNFKDLVKKIWDLISLWDISLAERWISEAINKENKSFNIIKDDHFITKRKLKIAQKEYDSKINILEWLNKKIFIIKSKQLLEKQQKEKKEIFANIKHEIDSLLKTKDFENAKNYIEKNISNQKNEIEIVDFLHKKNQEINLKIKNQAKSTKRNKSSIDEVNYLLKSIWEEEKSDLIDVDEKTKDNSLNDIIKKVKLLFDKFIEKIQSTSHKKIAAELKYLLENEKWFDDKKIKLINSKYHEWMSKILQWFNLNWYNFYGKILWADKITWDTFIFEEKKEKYWFALWDATGHWLKAWLIVSNFTKNFIEYARDFDKFESFAMNLNNQLKWTLKSWNFLTCHLFEIHKSNPSELNIIWMWHEPLYIYRKMSNSIEEYRPFWLAAWIRKILKIESIKTTSLKLLEWDVVVSYTDWIIEAKNSEGVMYWLDRFKQKFLEWINKHSNLKNVYKFVIDDLKQYSGKINYDDDVTIILFSRDSKTDIVNNKYIENIVKNLNISGFDYSQRKKLEWKTKQEVLDEINNLKLKKELNIITQKLHELLKDWEIIKLKEECLKYIRQWYVSLKINSYLKKAISLEEKYKIDIKNKKLQTKYNTLQSLYGRWDYKTVIKEAYDVILKNWNI